MLLIDFGNGLRETVEIACNKRSGQQDTQQDKHPACKSNQEHLCACFEEIREDIFIGNKAHDSPTSERCLLCNGKTVFAVQRNGKLRRTLLQGTKQRSTVLAAQRGGVLCGRKMISPAFSSTTSME